MTIDLATAMGRVLQQVRAGELGQATRTIQAALSPSAGPAAGPDPAPDTAPDTALNAAPRRAAGQAAAVEDAEVVEDRPSAPDHPPRRPLREVVDVLSRIRQVAWPRRVADAPAPSVPSGARFETRRFAGPHGARDYRLYVPATLPATGRGLVLMLHGCTQDPDDFAAGTRMNAQAERQGMLVVYPHQTHKHNAQGCWNWFRPVDQRADAGEPAVLAGLVSAVAAEFAVDPGRVFVAGLSAGGAMAATLAATHPGLFAAAGIHSGLPHGAAQDVISAFAAMRGEARTGAPPTASTVPTIVFHGTADATVHPSNGEAILGGRDGLRRKEHGQAPGGRSYIRETVSGPDGTVLAEIWRIEGAGHAWSGGSSDGSFTDPTGPDASAEMLRFFLESR